MRTLANIHPAILGAVGLKMVRINLKTEILQSRELRITLPDDVPTGPAEVVVVISPARISSTLGDLADSEFMGIWRDRTDIDDKFAGSFRSKGWKRTTW